MPDNGVHTAINKPKGIIRHTQAHHILLYSFSGTTASFLLPLMCADSRDNRLHV